MTTLTLSKCRRPILVNCLMVRAFRVFFSFARLTLQVVSYMMFADDQSSSLFPIDRLKDDSL